ncbi:MAG: type III secretion system export apparatus subunit SctV [Alphaproteobacteria bacterium]|nr:type III secretion system export apparatus subunit SctV [Alphaproteobacteria bacterium]
MTFSATLRRFLAAGSRRGDLIIATLVIISIAMMIIPLPTPVVDILIATNISVSALILMVAFYIAEPVELSSLPSVLLVATLFRLAITITTARLILLQADAGDIVSTFGTFVVGGNVAVGLVIFLIITVAQFVVITKGAERVAEVAARFSLDALPGKQMSIDSDMRSGEIDQAQARILRRRLAQESQFYGAMDGAMKFVRGDAIASLVVIVVNLIGGLAIGVMQQNMSFGKAAEIYPLLTVGDGLVAQIPALLISIAAGTVVTRVASLEQRDLGAEITTQFLGQPRALSLGAVVMLALAMIPGFPIPVFLTLAGLFAVGSFLGHRRARAPTVPSITDVGPPLVPGAPGSKLVEQPSAELARLTHFRVIAALGPGLQTAIPPQAFAEVVTRIRQTLAQDIGLEPPMVGLSVDQRIEPQHFHLNLEGVPVVEGEIKADSILVEKDSVHLELLAVPFEAGHRVIGQQLPHWVKQEHTKTLADAGIEFLTPVEALGRSIELMLRRYATQFLGIQETGDLLQQAERNYPELTKQALKIAPVHKVADILRRLLDENVPIANLRLILEAIVEFGPREQEVVSLVEYVRMMLRREICFRCADRNRVIVAYMLERAAEKTVRSSVQPTAVGPFLSISTDDAQPIIQRVRQALAAATDTRPVVLASMDVRRHLRNLLMRNDIDVPVLSYQELVPEFSVHPIATIADDVAVESTQGADAPITDGFEQTYASATADRDTSSKI